MKEAISPEEYDNFADHAAQDIIAEKFNEAYEVLKSLHPEIIGYRMSFYESEDGYELAVELAFPEH